MMVARKIIKASRWKIAKIILQTPITKSQGHLMLQWNCAGVNILCIWLNWPSWLVVFNIVAVVLFLGYLVPMYLKRRGVLATENDPYFRNEIPPRRLGRPARF